MAGVGPGTAIAGRYALRTIVHRAPRGQRWRAHDTATGHEVSVLLVPSDQPVAQAVVDAGRRATAIEDPRLVRVLDVGTDQGYGYVVEELDDDTRSLHDLLSDGPLAPEEARRVAGEASMVLERARQRGLHHEQLTPAHVAVRRDGTVRIRGLAVDAALADVAGTDGRSASRADALAVSALLYAGLTATWPLSGSTLTSSPRVGRAVVPPSELVPAVPADLDAVAVHGLAGGVVIPADLGEQLAPWSDRPVERVVEAGPAADTEAPRHEGPLAPEELPDELRGDIEHPPSRAAVAAGAVAAAAAAGSRRSAEAARAAAQRAAERAAERRRDNEERREAERASRRSFTEIAEENTAAPEPVVPVLAHDVTTSVPSRGQARFVLGCMGAFVAVALLLGVLGVWSMTKNINDKVAAGAGPTPTRTVTAPAVTVTALPGGKIVGPAPTPSSGAAAIPVVGVQSFDPAGDGTEHADTVDRVHDGDKGTTWTSSQYKTAQFSGLKPGVGVLVDLGQKAAVRTVTLETPAEAAGEEVIVYGADDTPRAVDGLPEIGRATVSGTSTTITASGTPAEHQWVVVWFTKAAASGGSYKVSLSEITLTS